MRKVREKKISKKDRRREKSIRKYLQTTKTKEENKKDRKKKKRKGRMVKLPKKEENKR